MLAPFYASAGKRIGLVFLPNPEVKGGLV